MPHMRSANARQVDAHVRLLSFGQCFGRADGIICMSHRDSWNICYQPLSSVEYLSKSELFTKATRFGIARRLREKAFQANSNDSRHHMIDTRISIIHIEGQSHKTSSKHTFTVIHYWFDS